MILLGKVWNFLNNLLIPEEQSIEKFLKIDCKKLRKILPKAERPLNRNSFALFDYRNKDVKNLISNIKYKNHPILIEKISSLLYEEILVIAEEKMIFENKNQIALIPIPMKNKDERKRGWNQSLELCLVIEKLSKNIGNIKITTTSILKKVKQTEHQRNLNKDQRLKNLNNSFLAISKLPEDALPIIIDDVTTTGATIEEARRALKNKGYQNVPAITIAH